MDWIFDHINVFVNASIAFGSVVGAFIYVRADLITLQNDVNHVKRQQETLIESLRQLNTILTQVAVQDARLHMIEKDIDELRHHKGYIN